jgi:hypothetical protein
MEFATWAAALVIGAMAGLIHGFWAWVVAGYAIGTVIHELGHLACATIGSIPVYRMVIGSGPVVWRSRIRETWFELRAWPLGGQVEPYPVMEDRRARWALFVAGGAMGNLAVIGLLVAWYAISAPADASRLLGPLLFSQVFAIVITIVPASIERGGNDGMQLLRLLWQPVCEPEKIRAAYNARFGGYGRGDTPLAMTAASLRLLYHSVRLSTGGTARAEALQDLEPELGRSDLSRQEKIWVLDALITDGLVSGDPAVRPRLDAWSQQALALGPDLPTLQGSRAAVLVELGRHAEAKEMVAPLAAPDQPASFDSFMGRAFLALAEHGLGNEAAARQAAAAARRTAEEAGQTESTMNMLARLDSVIAAGPAPAK